jgi:uncharacterized protein YhbP (UPF0306 family)
MDIKKRIQEVLNRGYLMSLGVHDDGGVWVSDVIYVHDDEMNIYWMSDPEVRHSKAIIKSSQAAGSITVTSYGEKPELGIQFYGRAEKIEGQRHDLATQHLSKRGKPAPQEGTDLLQGDSWYVLHPSKIDLIDAEHFGWEKRNLKL